MAFCKATSDLCVAKFYQEFSALIILGQTEVLLTVDHSLFLETPFSLGFQNTVLF